MVEGLEKTIKTVGIILIGSELLKGRVQDTNLKIIAEELGKVGLRITKCVIVHDNIEDIKREIVCLLQSCDLVITTGGIGPTHDDVTVEAVASALNKNLIIYPEIEELVKKIFGPNPNKAMLRMAKQPNGAKFYFDPVSRFPTVMVDRVVMFPGIPQLLKAKLPYFINNISTSKEKLYSVTIFLKESTEWELESVITEIASKFKMLEIGSYPEFPHKEFSLRITIDGSDKEVLEEALKLFLNYIPTNKIYDLQRSY